MQTGSTKINGGSCVVFMSSQCGNYDSSIPHNVIYNCSYRGNMEDDITNIGYFGLKSPAQGRHDHPTMAGATLV